MMVRKMADCYFKFCVDVYYCTLLPDRVILIGLIQLCSCCYVGRYSGMTIPTAILVLRVLTWTDQTNKLSSN